MKNIRLHGKLGDRFVKSMDLDVSTPIEVVSALNANFPEIRIYLAQKEQEGVYYGIKSRKTGGFLSKEEANMGISGGVDICPSPSGGMMLFMGMATSMISGYMNKKISEGMKQDNTVLTAETNSFIFKGKENRYEQGSGVPLGYGRMLVGSSVISASINNYDIEAEKGKIYTLQVGSYTMLPNYSPWNKYYDADLGPLKSSALREVAEGTSGMTYANPNYAEIKNKLADTGFGSNDGIYGSNVVVDGHEYRKKLGSGFFGTLTYKVIYNQGVEEAFLTNWTTGGNFTPADCLKQWPDRRLDKIPQVEKDQLAVLRFFNYNKWVAEIAKLVQKYYELPNWKNEQDTQYFDYVEESDIRQTAFAILQSEPCIETLDFDQEPRRFYPIAFSDGDFIDPLNPKLGNMIRVGSRYKDRTKSGGLGWHKFESVSVSKSIDLICEGPIEGFCDADGNHMSFSEEKVATNQATQPDEKDDYLRGVFLNDFPVKEVKEISSTKRQAVYNVNEFDIDVSRNDAGELGSNDQNLLEPKYQFIAETKQIGAKLFGPHMLDYDDAAYSAGTEIRDWSKESPFYNKKTYVIHDGQKYLCNRATSMPFNPLDNYIRDVYEAPHIVVKDPVFLPGSNGIISRGRLYQSTDVFVRDENDEFAIGEYIANSPYKAGDIVYERPEYLGSDPFGNDDEEIEIANNEELLDNFEDPDSITLKNAYWEAGGNAGIVKKWKPGQAYQVGDIVFESRNAAYKVISPIAEWDASVISMSATDAFNAKVEVISLTAEKQEPSGIKYFEEATKEKHKGFLAAINSLDSSTFSPLNISPGNTNFFTEIFAGEAPNEFKSSEGGPLYHDPTGGGSQGTEDRAPVFIMAGGDAGDLTFRQEEEYPVNHIIANQLVDQVLVSLEIQSLNYLYPGDKVEVTYEVGKLMLALMAGIVAVGAAADIMAEADEPFGVTTFIAAGMWGGLAGYVLGIALQGNTSFKIGTKIENSGETWPNKIRFRIKYGNEGEALYETDVAFFGCATSPYIKDIKLYLPKNPLGRTRIIKVFKISRERNPVKEGEQAMRYREDASLSSITEISNVKCSYPNTVTIGTRVNSKDMSSIPKRNYHLLLKKIKVPSNYDPLMKTYGEMWDGSFAKNLQWSDNPAWCLYDLISNNSYGLGKYGMDESFIDKWTFYRAAKYCDELIPTGYSSAFKKRRFKTKGGLVLVIDPDSYSNEKDFVREFGHPGKSVSMFYKNIKGEEIFLKRKIIATKSVYNSVQKTFEVTLDLEVGFALDESMSAVCCAEIYYPVLENRYRFNALLTSPQNAFKMINELANSFRAFTYWGGGKINFYLDEPKESLLLFGNNNVSEEGFSYGNTPRHSRTNACKIKYLDEHNAFKPKVEYVENREKIIQNGLYEETINSLGTSTKTQAHRVAEYTVQAGNLETELVSFTTSMPGSYLRPGDIIDVIDNKKTIGRFAGKVLNYDASGDGKVGYLDIDFPVRTMVDEEDSNTFKTIKLYNISGYDTLQSLNLKADPNQDGDNVDGQAISDEEIKSIRAGHLDTFTVGSITNNDTRIEIINNPYSFVSGSYNWDEAIRDARLRGGGVATINNDVDQRFVQTVMPRDRKQKAWIGGYYKEQPPPEEFVWLDSQDCINNGIDFFSWGDGFPLTPAPIGTDNSSNLMTDSYAELGYEEGFEIARDNLEAGNKNFIAVSGSEDKEVHADWITQDGLVRQGYILEKRADDRLLRLNGIDGLTYLLEDDVNMAKAKQFRVINIKERDNHTYDIEGIEYSSGKFGVIENNESLPIPKSPIIYTQKVLPPPNSVVLTYLEEDIDAKKPYGIEVAWKHPESTIRAYRVQIFDGSELKKTVETKRRGKFSQTIKYRDSSINEGGVYTARVESLH
jgi:predicted phage tail protein